MDHPANNSIHSFYSGIPILYLYEYFFSDCLILAGKKKDSYTYKRKDDLFHIEVDEIRNSNFPPNCFKLLLKSEPPKLVIYQAASEEKRREWLRALRVCIDNYASQIADTTSNGTFVSLLLLIL
jgi:hypothetical protein